MERLDKILAGTGRWSRREVKELVRQGRVRVDGQTARTAEEKVAPEAAAITVDGQPVETERFTYVMLHLSLIHILLFFCVCPAKLDYTCRCKSGHGNRQ